MYCIISCSHGTSLFKSNDYLITDRGLLELLEVGMEYSTFQQKEVEHYLKPEYELAPLSKMVFKVPSLSAEFELKDKQIIRIWFFTKKNGTSPVLFTLNDREKRLSSICSEDIISHFGPVIVFLHENPKKNENKAYWVKYDPFKVGINYIVYPDYPYLFYFDKNDMLSSITVSLETE